MQPKSCTEDAEHLLNQNILHERTEVPWERTQQACSGSLLLQSKLAVGAIIWRESASEK